MRRRRRLPGLERGHRRTAGGAEQPGTPVLGIAYSPAARSPPRRRRPGAAAARLDRHSRDSPRHAGPGMGLIEAEKTLRAPDSAGKIALSNKEFALLSCLRGHDFQYCSIADLHREVWPDAASRPIHLQRAIVSSVVGRPRRRARMAGIELPLRTSYGQGYTFVHPLNNAN
ncbi:hypothetical protein DAI43_24655 [Achromobacter xylosoxidans]|nr:hypothetical protein DAI43_24655 [Achromobacter xylosoxidans]